MNLCGKIIIRMTMLLNNRKKIKMLIKIPMMIKMKLLVARRWRKKILIVQLVEHIHQMMMRKQAQMLSSLTLQIPTLALCLSCWRATMRLALVMKCF